MDPRQQPGQPPQNPMYSGPPPPNQLYPGLPPPNQMYPGPPPPNQMQTRPPPQRTFQKAEQEPDPVADLLYALSMFFIALTFPVSLWFCFMVANEYERVVKFRMGHLVSGKADGPGLVFVNFFTDTALKVDLRVKAFDVPPQEVLSRDSVTVAVDAVVYYHVQDAVMSVTNVASADRSTNLLAPSILRNILGTRVLAEILAEREGISHAIQYILDEATDPWGIKVDRVEIKNVLLPHQMQRAMAAEAEATREARAKLISAEGEQKASMALKEAADVISESPCAMQLRVLQTLNIIAGEKNSTIIFPIPVELFPQLGDRHNRTGGRPTFAL